MNAQQIAEYRRLHYLQAMGVNAYIPRVQLPNAKASVHVPWPELATDASSVAAAEQEPPQSYKVTPEMGVTAKPDTAVKQAAASALAQLQAEHGEPVFKSVKSIPAPITDSAASQEQENTVSVEPPPEFQLSFIDFGDCLLIDSVIPKREYWQGYIQLLNNLAFALNFDGVTQANMDFSNFSWPLMHGQYIEQDANSARQTVQAMLAKRMLKKDYRAVMLLGLAAQKYCCDEQQQFVDASKSICIAPSLYSSLSQPAFKPLIWQAVARLQKEA